MLCMIYDIVMTGMGCWHGTCHVAGGDFWVPIIYHIIWFIICGHGNVLQIRVSTGIKIDGEANIKSEIKFYFKGKYF